MANHHTLFFFDVNDVSPGAKLVGMCLGESCGSDPIFSAPLTKLRDFACVGLREASLALEELWEAGYIKFSYEAGPGGELIVKGQLCAAEAFVFEVQAAPQTVPSKSRQKIFDKTGGLCFYCGASHLWLTIDHMQPKSRGGTDHADNLIGACGPCNGLKSNRTVEEFREFLRFKNGAESWVFALEAAQ